jgi:putative nucleotidyltransferase with HDIG domain
VDPAIQSSRLTIARRSGTRPLWLVGVSNGLALVCVLAVLYAIHLPSPSLQAGEVATRTVVASHRVTYVDWIATRAQRKQVEAAVPARYMSNVAAEQRVRQATAFFSRALPVLAGNGTATAKLQTLRSLVPPGATPGPLQALLGLSDSQLGEVQARTVALLSQAEQSSFDQTALTTTEVGLLSQLPDATSKQVKAAINAVLSTFITPTQVIDIAATNRARAAVAKSVPDVVNTVYTNQVVVRQGDLITPSAAQQLKALGLQTQTSGWQDIVGGIIFAVLVVGTLFWYLSAFQPGVLLNDRILLLFDACILAAVLGARLLANNHVLLPYFFPVAAATTFAAALISPEACVALALAMALLAGWIVTNSFELAIYYFLTAAAGALSVRRIRELRQFVVGGIYIAAMALGTQLAFAFVDRTYDASAMQDYVLSSAFNGFVSAAFALGAFAVLSGFFGVTTSLQLLELGQPSHPLLRRLMTRAPGTYNHSLAIASMVENAAEEIGANSLAAKLGALYHDIGKTTNPHAFVENQLGMSNIHDELRPEESARIIRGHVPQGLRLAQQHRLPRLVVDAIGEHHGTMTIAYFLHRAREEHPEEPIDVGQFMYPGPKPQSKETALLMLADGCEATVRAASDHSPSRIREIVERIVSERMVQGQLDECPLTLRDVEMAKDAFCAVLNGLYHPRIEYPDATERAADGAVIVEERADDVDPRQRPHLATDGRH